MSEPPEHKADGEAAQGWEDAETVESSDDESVERAQHDELAKALFGSKEEAISVLRSALPQHVSKLIDWSTLRSESTEQIDRVLKKRMSDVLFRVKLNCSTARGADRSGVRAPEQPRPNDGGADVGPHRAAARAAAS